MVDYRELFDASYKRIFDSPDKKDLFFRRFYEVFLFGSEEVQEKFKNTDMKTQVNVLKRSFGWMCMFCSTLRGNDFMKETANAHSKAFLDISPRLYDLWLDAIIQTLSEQDDQFNSNTRIAWRVTLAPGIEFMKCHY